MRWPWKKKGIETLLGPQFDDWFGRSDLSGIPGIKSDRASIQSYRAWVFDAVNLISNVTSTAEIELYIEKNGQEVPVTGEQFKWLNTWDNPHALFSGRMLRKLTQIYLELTGKGYILEVKNAMGFPEQMIPIPPDKIELKEGGGVFYFEHETQNGKKRWGLDDILYFRYADPRDPLGGYSPLKAVGMQHDVDMSIDSYQKTMFESGAYFNWGLTTDQTMSETQIKSMREGIYNSLKNLKDKFKPFVFAKGLTPTQLTRDALSLGTKDTSNQMRDKVLAAYGVPKALLGMLEGIQRANLEGTELIFGKGQIQPRLQMWADVLEPRLKKLDPRIKMRFKSTLPKDKEVIRQDAEAMQRMGAISVEEVREQFGFDPDFRSGDTILVPFNMVAVTADNQGGNSGTTDDKTVLTPPSSPAMSGKSNGAEDTVSAPAHLSKGFWTPEKKDLFQKQFEDETEARERRWMPPIKRWASKWEKEGLRIIELEATAAGAKYAGWGIARVRADYKVKQQVPDDIVALILESSGKLHTIDFKEAANEALAFVGVTDPFNMENPAVVEFLKTRTRRFTDELSIRYADDLEAILQAGIVEGQTVAEISKIFQETMGWEKEGYRATRIARTEVISVSNKARRDSYIEAGVPLKSWSSARDAVVRDSHIEADSRYSADPIPMTEEFVLVSGATGDPALTGDAAEDINCRCTLRPEREEDSRSWFSAHRKEILRIMSRVRKQDDDGPPMEDWAYLIHHIHIGEDGEEIVHHCPMLDHLGNLFEVDHIEGVDGEILHVLIGLLEDQEVLWSDEEALDSGFEVPCPGRQI